MAISRLFDISLIGFVCRAVRHEQDQNTKEKPDACSSASTVVYAVAEDIPGTPHEYFRPSEVGLG